MTTADLPAGVLLAPTSVTADRSPAPGQAVVGLSIEPGRAPSSALSPRDEVLVITGSGAPPRRAVVESVGDTDVSGRRAIDVVVAQADAEELALASIEGRLAVVLVGRG